MNGFRSGMGLVIIALLLVGVGVSYYSNTSESVPGTLHVETYIYKNGRLVLYDPDDPPVKKFMDFLARGLAGNVVAGRTKFNQYGAIFITNDTAQYSYTLSTIPEIRWEAHVSQVAYIDQEHAVEVSATITYNGTSPVNITAYGLYTLYYYYPKSDFYSDLVFYDVLDTPIQLNPGDSVTIVYKVSVP